MYHYPYNSTVMKSFLKANGKYNKKTFLLIIFVLQFPENNMYSTACLMYLCNVHNSKKAAVSDSTKINCSIKLLYYHK